MRVLGLSFDYHDAAACLLEDGELVAAAQEERFTRVKHDAAFPAAALRYCLAEAGPGPLDAVAFYEKPILKLSRILETALATAPRGGRVLARAVPAWTRERLWVEPRIRAALEALGVPGEPPLLFPEHHLSHAASAFFPSPHERAAVLTLDGVGEWATTTVGHGQGSRLELLESLDFPHGLGLLYAAFTHYCGFRVLSGEYKLMGLAPYGEPRFREPILEHLVDLRPDGSFRLHLERFGFLCGLRMTNRRFHRLFGGGPRRPESPLGQREADLARSVQEVTEEIVLRMARHAHARTGARALCLAGGVALNCVANGRLLREGPFDDVWVQPAAGDAGGAIGAAFAAHHLHLAQARSVVAGRDKMRGCFLGPEWPPEALAAYLDGLGVPRTVLDTDEAWAARVAALLAEGEVVGLFMGRMELGPRALGNRSIVADPASPGMQARLNAKIKRREPFRPFAPAVLEERAADHFELDRPSPYMLFTCPVRGLGPGALDGAQGPRSIPERAARARGPLPAVTHVDGSARVQTVSASASPRFHALLRAFEGLTGKPVLVNTSFNVRGEPIVCTPADAYRCFVHTDLDALCLGPFLLGPEAKRPALVGPPRVAGD